MKVFLLAAGKSSRMAPLKDKNFMEFSGIPLVVRVALNAYAAGLKDFSFVVSEDQKDDLASILQNYECLSSAPVLVQHEFDSGQAGAVQVCLETVPEDDSILIMNGNDCVDKSVFEDVLHLHNAQTEIDGSLVCKRMDAYFPGGYIEIDQNQKITSIVEKPGSGNEPSDLVNIVIHYFRSSDQLKKTLQGAEKSTDDAYEVCLHKMFHDFCFKAIAYDGPWGALKYPWHTLSMMHCLFEVQSDTLGPDFTERASGVWVHNSAVIKNTAVFNGSNIVVDAGAKVFDYAVINGPAYIGKNAVVGTQGLVRESCIGEASVVGYSTEIARSWFGKGVTTHMAYIGDSIVGSRVNFGAYSCTANLRLDKKTVRMLVKDEKIDSGMEKLGAVVGEGAQIGVHAMLMPGSKIEARALVGPGEKA